MACCDNIKGYSFTAKKGQRLFQIVAPNCSNIEYTIKDNLSNSSRGKGGFGSTGK